MTTINKLSIDDIEVKGKKVLVRCDFNVPIINGEISDDTRIKAALPTIEKLIRDGAKIVLCSHIGKTKDKKTLEPVANRLSVLLSKKVLFKHSDIVIDDDVKSMVSKLRDGDLLLLENTRLREEEEKCGDDFSQELANLVDGKEGIFVDDAFGTAHRAHSSNVGVTKYIDCCVSGYLIKKEIEKLVNAVENPVRPFVAILGGAKVSDKLKVIDKLLDKCDKLIIGGGMSYTFLKAQGKNVGKSLVDEEKLIYCEEMIKKAESLGKQLILPIDCIAAKEFPNPINNKKVENEYFTFEDIKEDYMALDIGEESIKLFMKELYGAKTVIWNGPMGVFENEKYAIGTYCIARCLSDMKDATTIIGGGDSASAVTKFNLANKMSHVSTGGGATLEYLEGIELPGILSLTDK